jgi:hypothetical protein
MYYFYTATSVRIRDAQGGDVAAINSIETFVRALQDDCTTCPGLRSSLGIINNKLNNLSASISEVGLTIANIAENYLPAFSYLDTSRMPFEQGGFQLVDSEYCMFLDCFPETSFNG